MLVVGSCELILFTGLIVAASDRNWGGRHACIFAALFAFALVANFGSFALIKRRVHYQAAYSVAILLEQVLRRLGMVDSQIESTTFHPSPFVNVIVLALITGSAVAGWIIAAAFSGKVNSPQPQSNTHRSQMPRIRQWWETKRVIGLGLIFLTLIALAALCAGPKWETRIAQAFVWMTDASLFTSLLLAITSKRRQVYFPARMWFLSALTVLQLHYSIERCGIPSKEAIPPSMTIWPMLLNGISGLNIGNIQLNCKCDATTSFSAWDVFSKLTTMWICSLVVWVARIHTRLSGTQVNNQ